MITDKDIELCESFLQHSIKGKKLERFEERLKRDKEFNDAFFIIKSLSDVFKELRREEITERIKIALETKSEDNYDEFVPGDLKIDDYLQTIETIRIDSKDYISLKDLASDIEMDKVLFEFDKKEVPKYLTTLLEKTLKSQPSIKLIKGNHKREFISLDDLFKKIEDQESKMKIKNQVIPPYLHLMLFKLQNIKKDIKEKDKERFGLK
jgi:hypothetical protein